MQQSNHPRNLIQTANLTEMPQKYSLRQRFHRTQKNKQEKHRQLEGGRLHADMHSFTHFDSSNTLINQVQELRTKIMKQDHQFTPTEITQRQPYFNQISNYGISNQQQTLSTTPSFQNPFAKTNCRVETKHSLQSDQIRKQEKMQHSRVISCHEITPSNTKSYKTTGSYQTATTNKYQSNQRINTQYATQPISQVNSSQIPEDMRSERQFKQKYSLRQYSRQHRQSKPQFFMCLKYADLAEPLMPTISDSWYDSSRILPDNMGKNGDSQLTKFLCSSFKDGRQGCQCQPKCYWIDRWLNMIGNRQLEQLQYKLPEKQWQNNLKQIDKDMPRTQPEHPTFQSPNYIAAMREVLVEYCRMDGEVGYVQGMNFIAACIVYHARNTYQALRIFEHVMKTNGFRVILLHNLSFSGRVAAKLVSELRRLSFDLYTYLMQEGIELEMFVTSWYFSMLGNFMPLHAMHLVLDKFIRRQFAGLNEVILAMLIYMKEELFAMREGQLMLAFSNQKLTIRATQINWSQLIARSDNLQLPPVSI